MKIDGDLCISCRSCIPICPVGAISLAETKESVVIDWDSCVECRVCIRSRVCPVEAFIDEELEGNRKLRRTFSDPVVVHGSTKIPGRGTSEMKTNDVKNEFKKAEVGIGIEVGRPGVSTSLIEVEKLTTLVSYHPVDFIEGNPITALIDTETGRFKETDIVHEKVLSAIIEIKAQISNLKRLLKDLYKVRKRVDTVFSLELITSNISNNRIPPSLVKIVSESGFEYRACGKTNIGLGRRD